MVEMKRTQETLKEVFRDSCLKRLKKASRNGSYSKDKEIIQRLYAEITLLKAVDIMLYLPLQTEADISSLIGKLRREGKRLYVPFMEGESFRLVKYRLPLERKKFGIKEPKNSKQYRRKTIDLAIVPIVGLDASGRRVGFGKGMYDRFYERENKNIKKTVFVARALCFSPVIVTDDYDVKADMVIAR